MVTARDGQWIFLSTAPVELEELFAKVGVILKYITFCQFAALSAGSESHSESSFRRS
jgi:hypothetical protein